MYVCVYILSNRKKTKKTMENRVKTKEIKLKLMFKY